jgi:hypothetical protein
MTRLARRTGGRPVIEFFASGLLHTEKDFLGVTLVGALPGIIAAANVGGRLRYEEKVPPWVAKHLQAGGRLFCDSGAFTVAFSGKVLDFNRVFRFYLQLLKLCQKPSQLIIVMPDSVAEQHTTIRLWHEYHDGVAWWLRRDCACLFPMQGSEHRMTPKGPEVFPGQLTLPEIYAEACAIFGGKVAAALPMKKAATKASAVLSFAKAARPLHLHLLGMGRLVKSVDLAKAIVRASPQTVVTADAVETTTAYGGRHVWMTPAALAGIARRKKRKGGKRRDIWYRDRIPGPDDAEVNWWLPTPAMGGRWQDRFSAVVQELVVNALERGKISDLDAEHALRSPKFARKLFHAEFPAYDAVLAMADHMVHRMAQVPVPLVSEI